jgi:hypothetical protein
MAGAGGGIGNSVSTKTSEASTLNELIDTKLNNSSLTNTVQNLISKTIASTIVNNSSSIQQIISANNSINFSGGTDCAPMTGDLTLTNITQRVIIDAKSVNTSIQTVISNITSSVNNSVVSSLSNITNDESIKSNTEKISSTLQGVADKLAEGVIAVADDVKKVLGGALDCAGIGNECDTNELWIR